jgi:hypothetical protein
MQLLLSLPFWAFLLVTIVIIYAALEAGHIAGIRRRQYAGGTKDELGSMVTAMLGLLGFILAITFGTQLSRFDTGKTLLLEEANAIHATWLRAGIMPEPYRGEARSILRHYVDVRAASDRDVFGRIAESEAMQSRLWEISLDGIAAMEVDYPRELLLESLNELISLHEQRVTVSVMQHMPGAFWIVLYSLTILAFGLAGYEAGCSGSGRSAAGPIAVIGFSLLVLLIADLDQPGRGALRFDQSALEYVATRMDTHEEHLK